MEFTCKIDRCTFHEDDYTCLDGCPDYWFQGWAKNEAGKIVATCDCEDFRHSYDGEDDAIQYLKAQIAGKIAALTHCQHGNPIRKSEKFTLDDGGIGEGRYEDVQEYMRQNQLVKFSSLA